MACLEGRYLSHSVIPARSGRCGVPGAAKGHLAGIAQQRDAAPSREHETAARPGLGFGGLALWPATPGDGS